MTKSGVGATEPGEDPYPVLVHVLVHANLFSPRTRCKRDDGAEEGIHHGDTEARRGGEECCGNLPPGCRPAPDSRNEPMKKRTPRGADTNPLRVLQKGATFAELSVGCPLADACQRPRGFAAKRQFRKPLLFSPLSSSPPCLCASVVKFSPQARQGPLTRTRTRTRTHKSLLPSDEAQTS